MAQKKKTVKKVVKKKSPKKETAKAIASPKINTTVSVKQISNGYIINEETHSKNGGWKNKEKYSKTKPKISIK